MSPPEGARGRGPAVILVDPQLGENIGMVARAMLNCGLADLRLVRPRDGWPNPAAAKAASGADAILEAARVYDATAAAVAGLQRLYATTKRPRELATAMFSPRAAAAELRTAEGEGVACGLLFGPERSGLVNDDIALADAVIQVPLNPAFASLNLAQAVLLVGYEWWLAAPAAPAEPGAERVATKEELIGFFERLEAALDAAGFLKPPEKRPNMVRNLRTLFTRARLSEQELRTLHGIVSALARPRR